MLSSLDLHGEVGKAVVTERVETGQCPGLSVAIQTDWTGQLLLEILESLTRLWDAFSVAIGRV